jgi:hypothetical protein
LHVQVNVISISLENGYGCGCGCGCGCSSYSSCGSDCVVGVVVNGSDDGIAAICFGCDAVGIHCHQAAIVTCAAVICCANETCDGAAIVTVPPHPSSLAATSTSTSSVTSTLNRAVEGSEGHLAVRRARWLSEGHLAVPQLEVPPLERPQRQPVGLGVLSCLPLLPQLPPLPLQLLPPRLLRP